MSEHVKLSSFKQTFLGECFGVGLKQRSSTDKHVEFVVLVEDDESWFVSQHGGSSFWIAELHEQVGLARGWIEAHCELEPNGFGWKFR